MAPSGPLNILPSTRERNIEGNKASERQRVREISALKKMLKRRDIRRKQITHR